MNLNIFKTPDPSGRMSKIKYLEKNHPVELKCVIDYCIINGLDELPFKEKVYCFINNISKEVKCKNPNCLNKVKFKNSTIGYYEYCSYKCISSDPMIIEKKKEKSIDKFGTKTPAESEEIKQKIIKTNQKKYGGNSPMSSIDVFKKSRTTLKKNWGVNNPSESEILKNKRVKSFKNNIDRFKESFRKTSLEKYGVSHPWMLNEIHDKSIQKIFYEGYEDKMNEVISYVGDEFLDFYLNDSQKVFKIRCKFCEEEYLINSFCFNYRVSLEATICTKCSPVGNGYNVSNSEKKILDFIKNNYNGEIITNTRSIISPNELDIYLPDLKIAFEFNGLYWHSELNKDKFYHKNKTLNCLKKGIKLIHIWEDDWVYNQDVVKSMILNNIGVKKNIFWARKCKIVENIDFKLSREFLNQNHIQGYSPFTYSIGLLYNDELVSLMTFCKPRKLMGQKLKDNVFELSRFCSKKYTNVIGGASKLLNFFNKKYSPEEIFSFSDNSYSTGNLYQKLGFTFSRESELNYYWVIDKKRKHRYNFRKSNLIKMGYDKNKSERDIMYEDVGSYRVWGCGMKKWIYKNKNRDI